MTNALLYSLIASTFLFLLEIRLAVWAIQLDNEYQLSDVNRWEDEEIVEDERSTGDADYWPMLELKSLNAWQEIVSFLLLLTEDFPKIFILMFTFSARENGNLFCDVFVKFPFANWSLFGTFLSCSWKFMLSIGKCLKCCNFCRSCCTEFYCCFCRVFRPVLAITLLASTPFLFTIFNAEIHNARIDCQYLMN